MKYTFTRSGRMVVRPTAEDHPDDAALSRALSCRAFARAAVESARALCADITARPIRWATATGEPTEWDDRTTLVDIAVDLIDWRALPRDADGEVMRAIYVLIYGVSEPYGTAAVTTTLPWHRARTSPNVTPPL